MTHRRARKRILKNKTMKTAQNKQKINKMAGLSPNISIITLNIRDLNISVRRERVAGLTM